MSYKDGKAEAPNPKPCAGKNGTVFTVEDLFYNNPTRRKAIKNPADEYQHILRVLRSYSIHNSGVSFSCKKMNESLTDLHTSLNASIMENIRQLYGENISKSIENLSNKHPELQFDVSVYFSKGDSGFDRNQFIIFINSKFCICFLVLYMFLIFVDLLCLCVIVFFLLTMKKRNIKIHSYLYLCNVYVV
jgi:DNA mismatch repair protein MLH1